MWWNFATKMSYYSWARFKDNFFKFQGVAEKEFFANLTKIQQKGGVEEYTYEWESLET
jgi:hypothetical protein